MIKITRRPHQFSFSKNPIQYTFSVDEFADDGCFVLAKIFVRDIGGGTPTLLYEEKIKTLSGTVNYAISDIVESTLEYAMPDFAGAVLQEGNNIKEFYIDFAVITDDNPDATYITDAPYFFYGIKGGIASPIWDWNNYFVNYVPANKPFLTWQPNNRFIGKSDNFFLSFLNSTTASDLTLIVDAEYTDGDTYQVVTDFTESDKILYHFKAGADQLGLNAAEPTKKLYKYSISIVSKADHAIIFAAPYTYYIDYRPFYNCKYLHYYNSLGGIESVRVRGEIESDIDLNYADAERFEGAVIIGTPTSEQYTQTSKSKTDSFKGDTGFFHTAKEQDVLQELLLTRFAWERILEQNWRIYALGKSIKLRSSTDKLWAFPIEWRYSFTNSVYTPMLDLGEGSYATICTAVDIVGTPILPDGIEGVAYAYSFDLSGDTLITLGTVTKPAWMTIAISGSTVNITGTPGSGSAGTGISVSIQFLNCAASSKTFADTIDITCISIPDNATDLPTGKFGVAYSYSIPVTSLSSFTLDSIVKPSWMTITKVGTDIVFSGTPDALGSITVSFTITGCANIEFASSTIIASECRLLVNSTMDTISLDYTPCGGSHPIWEDVPASGLVCGKFPDDLIPFGFDYIGPC